MLGIIIFALIINDTFDAEQFFFLSLGRTLVTVLLGSILLIVYGIVLSFLTPAEQIDEMNQSYQNESVSLILLFMLAAVLFEELLFRGIIQNSIVHFISNEWIAIILTTGLFILFHVQYFKKPLMLLNITLPSFVFCWAYSFTDNIFVPVIIHFLMNSVITLLFKFQIINIKDSSLK
ncbi:lysostaphin resistance A-like protein [Paenibacillus sp. 22594]|uniref:CPBP family intramembrane glutamic endopeptidase n=1 Tax=Paenibacillus sp. 22594 TaxID=3453947 RepID=UPI003F84FFC5